MFSITTHFHFFSAFAFLILSSSAAPPPSHDISTTSTSRIAVYEDINAQFRLVYAVSNVCPQIITFGEPTIDKRQVAVLPLSSVNEDGILCTGPSPLNFVGEENIFRPDGLLEKLQLGGMRQALKNNPNANQLLINDSSPSLLVGWHNGERTCNVKVYPQDTIYFIINEDNGKTISLKKPTQRDVVTIPPSMRALLIVAPSSNICLLADTASNANEDVTVTVVPDDGSPPTTTPARPAGAPPAPPSSAAPAPTAIPSPATSTAAPAGPTAPPTVTPAASAQASPVASPVSSVAPGSGDSPAVAPVSGAPVSSTPTASQVAPVPGASVPNTSIAPSASPVGVGAVLPNETPDVVEIVPSPEDDIVVENTTPSDTEDGSACFPSTSTVIVESGGVKTMSELEVGDRVLTDTGFSDVILFTHREDKSRNIFIRVTVSGGDSLVVSPGHYVYSNERRLKAARSLRKGDVLNKIDGEEAVIIGIESVSAVGLFNPQTQSGTIVVDGLMASTYTTTVDPLIAHWVLMVPVRWIYRISPNFAAVISGAFNHGSPLLASLLPKGASEIV